MNIQTDKTGPYIDIEVKGVTQRLRWIPGSTDQDGFWLADTACTQELWESVTGDNPSYFKGEQLPVEKVSYVQIQEFIKQLNELTDNLEFELPTEEEWEFACRAGSTTNYWWGDDITKEQANYASEETEAVKSYAPNPYGLHQMHGNVWEWTSSEHK